MPDERLPIHRNPDPAWGDYDPNTGRFGCIMPTPKQVAVWEDVTDAPEPTTITNLFRRAVADVKAANRYDDTVAWRMNRVTLDDLAIENIGRPSDGDATMFGRPIVVDSSLAQGVIEAEDRAGRRRRIMRIASSED